MTGIQGKRFQGVMKNTDLKGPDRMFKVPQKGQDAGRRHRPGKSVQGQEDAGTHGNGKSNGQNLDVVS